MMNSFQQRSLHWFTILAALHFPFVCPWLFQDGPIWGANNAGQTPLQFATVAAAWRYMESSLICHGDRPDWLPEAFADYRSLVAICASQEFGGDERFNLGGYHPTRDPINIVFKEIGWLKELDYIRTRLYCRAKCMRPDAYWQFLGQEYPDRDAPFESHWSLPLPVVYDGSGYGIVNFDANTEVINKGHHSHKTPAAHVFFGHFNPENALKDHPDRDLHAEYSVEAEPDMMIRCRNDITPTWPIDYSHYQFLYPFYPDWTFNGLCRAAFNGGLEEGLGNAGGVCRTGPDGKRHVYFEDEFSHPYLSWKWEPAALPVALYCFRNCWCGNDPDGVPEETVPWYNDAVVSKASDSMVITTTANGAPQSTTVYKKGSYPSNDLPSWFSPGSKLNLGGCVKLDNGEQFCLPSTTQVPPAPQSAKVPSLTSDSSQTCGSQQSCRGLNECGGHLCRCVVNIGEKLAQALGQDPVFPVGACLGLSQLVLSSKRGRHGRRSLEPPACACNGSYVSRACCDSGDGMIWEARENKLGKLDDLK